MSEVRVRIGRLTVDQGAVADPATFGAELQAAIAQAMAGGSPTQAGSPVAEAGTAIAHAVSAAGRAR